MNRSKKYSKTIAVILSVIMGVIVNTGMSFPSSAPADSVQAEDTLKYEKNSFIRAGDDQFYDSTGAVWQIRSIGFGNDCWSNHNRPLYSYCDESSYKELAELGFNTVRFYLNYGLFEQDNSPYHYSEEGFAWLDQNLEWAAKYGIKILFNIHYPQGGFQSTGDGIWLWRNWNGEQQRLIALWGAIAERYADNPTVLGYGLLNEPYLLWLGSTSKTLAQWENLAQAITDEIRAVDQNHILFVEAAIGTIEPYSGQTLSTLNDNYNLISVKDPADNLAYEIHFYQPMEFTHMEDTDTEWTYPDAGRAILSGNDIAWVGGSYPSHINKQASREDGTGWTYIETLWMDPSQYDSNLMNLTLSALNLGDGDTVYLDDLQVTAYNRRTETEQIIYTEDFSTDDGWSSFNNSGGRSWYSYLQDTGHTNNGCFMITGQSSYSVLQQKTPHYIALEDGFLYKVSAWVKVESDSGNTQAFPQMSFYKSASSGSFTKDYLENLLLSYVDAARQQGGPLFIGEFGILSSALEYGGAEWLSDVLAIMEEQEISYSFHLYHGGDFALYPNSSYVLPDEPNGVFYRIFQEYVG